MISQTVARRYAHALLALGQEDGNFAKYGEELGAFAALMTESDLIEALGKPIYPADVRRSIMRAVLAKTDMSPMMKNFLGLLQDKGRIDHLPDINRKYQNMVDEANNVRRATIVTAGPVADSVKNQVKATLEKMTGQTIILEATEDPEIIGGVVAQVGDLTLDGSVKTQLRNLKESLIKG